MKITCLLFLVLVAYVVADFEKLGDKCSDAFKTEVEDGLKQCKGNWKGGKGGKGKGKQETEEAAALMEDDMLIRLVRSADDENDAAEDADAAGQGGKGGRKGGRGGKGKGGKGRGHGKGGNKEAKFACTKKFFETTKNEEYAKIKALLTPITTPEKLEKFSIMAAMDCADIKMGGKGGHHGGPGGKWGKKKGGNQQNQEQSQDANDGAEPAPSE